MLKKKKSAFIWITIITIICKGLGFVKNSVLAYYYGTSPIVDAYVMTFSIGLITTGWIAGLIGNFTPLYKQLEVKQKERVIYFSGNIFNGLYIVTFLLILLLLVFTPQIVCFVAPGFTGETFALTVLFFRIYVISLLFYVGYRFFKEYLNCNQYHILAVVPDVFMSSVCILAICISQYTRKEFLILGYVIAVLLQFVFELVFAKQKGFRFCKGFVIDTSVKKMLQMSFPIFLSDTLAHINVMIDKIFASRLDSGTVSAMEYATTMREFVYQIGTIAILTTLLPVLSKLNAEKKIDDFFKKTIKSLRYMTLFYVPITMGIVIMGDWVIEIVYMRGSYDALAAKITTECFIIYSLGLIALVYRCVFLQAFCAQQKTKYILLVSSINVVLNVILNCIFVEKLGYIGLTLATTIASVVCVPIYFILTTKIAVDIEYGELGKVAIKSFGASLVMLILICPIKYNLLNFEMGMLGKSIAFFFITLFGMNIYLFAIKILKIDEVDLLYKNLCLNIRRMYIKYKQ